MELEFLHFNFHFASRQFHFRNFKISSLLMTRIIFSLMIFMEKLVILIQMSHSQRKDSTRLLLTLVWRGVGNISFKGDTDTYSSGQKKVSVPLLKRRKKCGGHLNKRRSCLSVLLAYFRRTLNVPYRACSQYSLRVSIFKRYTTPPTDKLSSLFTV